MSLDAVTAASEQIRDEIASRYPSLMESLGGVQNHVAKRIWQWESSTKSVLYTAFPFSSHEQKLSDWQYRLQSPLIQEGDLGRMVDDYASFCKAVGHPANEEHFWRKQFAPEAAETRTDDDTSISARLLLSQWRKRMDQARVEWELAQIELLRAALMKEFESLLKLLQLLDERLQSIGLNTGILLDLSKGNLTAQDIQQLERWARYLAEDEGVRALCDLLGKIRQIELSDRIERVRSVSPIQVSLPDINSQEEIVGVRLGRDLEHILPAELALLADPDTAVLFDLKYVESRLMCFDMQGIQNIHRHVETEEERKRKEAEKRGPMVICVDTSGSMNGMPETIAKAVVLFLAAKAREQKRPCYLINFSTGIDTLDLGADVGMEALMRFLQMSFHGGTDVAPALSHALDTMNRDAYRNADLLIISDFIMSYLPKDMLSRIENHRMNGTRFYSLVIGSSYLSQRMKSLFDTEWVYDPQSSRIRELIRFQQSVGSMPASDL